MSFRIVSDSSSNLMHLEGVDYTTTPLKIVFGGKEFVDDAALNVAAMVEELKRFKGKSGSSCPNVQEWLDAYEGADEIVALTISGELSGSYSAAKNAAREYVAENPGRKVWVLDTRAAGPEMCMIIERIKELVAENHTFEVIQEKVSEYHRHLHTLFCLESMNNLARNGRVSVAAATIASVLGIRAVGDVKHGQITAVHKPRGQKKATETLVKMMEERGLVDGALVRIAHCFGLDNAESLKAKVLEKFPNCRVRIEQTAGLCSFYAEAGGLMIGMEGTPHPQKP